MYIGGVRREQCFREKKTIYLVRRPAGTVAGNVWKNWKLDDEKYSERRAL